MFFTVVFCCCLCDCRVPKTGYDKGDAENADDDGSDTEPSVFHSKPLQAGKLVNGSSQQIGDKKKRPDSENEDGKVNAAFVGEKETPAQGKGWKTVQKTMLSRQPWLLRDLKQKYKVTLQQHEEKYLRGNDAILVFFRFKRALTRPFCVWSSIHAGKKVYFYKARIPGCTKLLPKGIELFVLMSIALSFFWPKNIWPQITWVTFHFYLSPVKSGLYIYWQHHTTTLRNSYKLFCTSHDTTLRYNNNKNIS